MAKAARGGDLRAGAQRWREGAGELFRSLKWLTPKGAFRDGPHRRLRTSGLTWRGLLGAPRIPTSPSIGRFISAGATSAKRYAIPERGAGRVSGY